MKAQRIVRFNAQQLREMRQDTMERAAAKAMTPRALYEAARNAAPGSREYRRENYLQRNYGITSKQYESMLTHQKGKCDICRSVCSSGRRLAVDHCHDTKKVRGLLCSGCNTSLGRLKDSPVVLAVSLVYLAKHGKALTTEEVDELTRDLHHYT